MDGHYTASPPLPSLPRTGGICRGGADKVSGTRLRAHWSKKTFFGSRHFFLRPLGSRGFSDAWLATQPGLLALVLRVDHGGDAVADPEVGGGYARDRFRDDAFTEQERGKAAEDFLGNGLQSGPGHQVAKTAGRGVVHVSFAARDADVVDEPTPWCITISVNQ